MLYLPSITIAEIGYGLQVLPDGKRRSKLQGKFDLFVKSAFAQRILGFDHPAADAYAEIMSNRKLAGRPMSILDGQIAAIAKSQNLAVATRNIKDFESCGLELINPFNDN